MAELPIQYIFFVIAMMFSGHGDVSTITVTKDSTPVITWSKRADGAWNAQEISGEQKTDAGAWSLLVTDKMMVLAQPPGGTANAQPRTVNVSQFLKVGEGKPDPETIDIAGDRFTVARHGTDVILTLKGNAEHHMTISYSAGNSGAADAASVVGK